jgi:hypothetical protein
VSLFSKRVPESNVIELVEIDDNPAHDGLPPMDWDSIKETHEATPAYEESCLKSLNPLYIAAIHMLKHEMGDLYHMASPNLYCQQMGISKWLDGEDK